MMPTVFCSDTLPIKGTAVTMGYRELESFATLQTVFAQLGLL